ncbi:LysR family transcriptional regulator [Bradyrhizobium sp. Cp5.3]|uniref:LysR family transcriptional regulator n=1 Tax=Bradyrhizobium sp. Cp5.3 TaxID=443598 RepID=UPI000427A23D|nr:LysR family transcriptional regulator [Bradyrhizobium sp. Cp5.3]
MQAKTRHFEGGSYFGVNLRDLQVFHVLAEARSMIVAAERIGVTQSAVSQSVARLESWLKTELVDRSSRPIRITHSGELLRQGVSEILESVQRTVEEVRLGSKGNIPIVRLGLVDSFATTAGPEIVKGLSERVDQLLIWSGISPVLASQLLDRSLDIIVASDAMAEHPELARQILFREALVAAVPRHAADRFREISIEAMCSELPFVRFTKRSQLGRMVEYYLSQRRLAPQKNLEFDASEAVLRMVSGGIGWTITTPLCLLQSHLKALDIEVLPLPPPLCFRRLCIIYRPGELVQITQQIIELCRDCVETSILPSLKKLAPWPEVVSRDVQADVPPSVLPS